MKKVKIIKSSLPSYWYADRIGETFDVGDNIYNNLGYKVVGGGYLIYKDDCELISCTNDFTIKFDRAKLDETLRKFNIKNRISIENPFKNDLSYTTMLFEETITFTEDEQFDIQLIDEMLEHLIK